MNKSTKAYYAGLMMLFFSGLLIALFFRIVGITGENAIIVLLLTIVGLLAGISVQIKRIHDDFYEDN